MATPSGSETNDKQPLSGITLLDFALVLVRNRILITAFAVSMASLGLAYSLLVSETYTSHARVVREAPDQNLPGGLSGGLAGLSGLGLGMFGSESGLTTKAYPEILRSREVRLAVSTDTLYLHAVGRRTTLIDYYAEQQGGLRSFLGSLFSSEDEGGEALPDDGVVLTLTKDEERAIENIQENTSSSVDSESGIMTVTVNMKHPRDAALVLQRMLYHLSKRVREIRTKKTKEDLAFIQSRFKEVAQELSTAEDQLATFLDRNQQVNSPKTRFERDRLQRKVGFKEQLYRDLQTQLTQAQLDLQRQRPVITVIEQPVPPKEKTSPKRLLLTILFFLVGALLGVGSAFLRYFGQSKDLDSTDERIQEIYNTLTPAFVKRSLS